MCTISYDGYSGKKEVMDMRLKKLGILVVIITLFCTGCWKPNYDNEPSNMPGTRWVSENPDIWFEIPEDRPEDGRYYGELTLGGEKVRVKITFGYFAPEIYIVRWDKEVETNEDEIDTGVYETDIPLVKGECDYQSDKCIVTLYADTDTLFNGKYETITFIKEQFE